MNFGIKTNKSGAEKQSISLIKAWITSRLQILKISNSDRAEEIIQILVNEVQCSEPNCVPVETLIVIIFSQNGESEGNKKWIGKILKPLVDVKQSDVMALDLPIDWVHYISSNEENSFGETPIKYSALCSELSRIVDQVQEANTLRQMQEEIRNVLNKIDDKLTKKLVNDAPITTSSASMTITRVKMTSTTSKSAEPQVDKVSVSDSNSPSAIITATTYLSRNNVRVPLSDAIAQNDETRETSSSSSTTSISSSVSIPVVLPAKNSRPLVVKSIGEPVGPRHSKEKRQRGCPCCDPDSVENLIDKMIFLEHSPN